jgi:cell division GTPase FtsZ
MPNLREYMEEDNKKNMSNTENLEGEVDETAEDETQTSPVEEATEEANFDAEAFTDDDLGVDIPDIPLPSEAPAEVKIEDKFDSAYKFAIVGVGQGGSRLAETFWKLGYRRVAVINTATQDLKSIKVPRENKLLVGGDGAGKDRKVAENIFRENREDILDFLKRVFKGGFDRALVCIGAGGGTGAGGGPVVVEIVHDLCEAYGIEVSETDARVGSVVALPTRAEGSRVQQNAKETADTLIQQSEAGTLSPLVILDNERIKQIYPRLSVNQFWGTANTSICSLFHLFNKIACQDSQYTAFDKADLDTIFSSGIISFGAVPVLRGDGSIDETDISHAVRDNLKKNILANIEVSTGNVAGCVVIGDRETLDDTAQESLEHGFEQLTRLLGEGSTVHRGIYHTSKKGLVVYTIIGGIEAPEQLFA